LTGDAAKEWIKAQEEAENSKLKAQNEKEELKKLIAEKLQEKVGRIGMFLERAKTAGNAKIVVEVIGDIGIEGLRVLADKIREKADSSVIILCARTDDKVSFVVAISEDLIRKGASANLLAKELAGSIDGSGGGKDNFAQGGGKAPAKLDNALEQITVMIRGKLK
jgi:alanyl-tRNA synthetase